MSTTSAAAAPSPASKQARHVFVYGTLRQGGSNDINHFSPAPRYVGSASLPGVMYDLGPYPGVLLGGDGLVHGEVYAVSAELERKLDVLEEIWPEPTGEYFKREVRVTLSAPPANQMTLMCFVYEINPQRVEGRSAVSTGDWIKSTAAPDVRLRPRGQSSS